MTINHKIVKKNVKRNICIYKDLPPPPLPIILFSNFDENLFAKMNSKHNFLISFGDLFI